MATDYFITSLSNYLTPKFSKYIRWRKQAKILKLSKTACLRLEWIIYYYTIANKNVRLICRYYGIAPKTFYKWFKIFDGINLRTLESKSRAPRNVRKKEYTPIQYERIVKLRKQYIRYGKMKLLKLYEKDFPQDKTISSWKI